VKVFLSFVAMISCTVMANILLKIGATGMRPGGDAYISKLFSWQVSVGIVCLGIAALLYLYILSFTPLNLAQSFAAAQFVAVVLAARVFLNEPILSLQWVGMICIAFGIVIVGLANK